MDGLGGDGGAVREDGGYLLGLDDNGEEFEQS